MFYDIVFIGIEGEKEINVFQLIKDSPGAFKGFCTLNYGIFILDIKSKF